MNPGETTHSAPSSGNAAEGVLRRLRAAIVMGEIEPGTPLAEPVLAKRYGVSRAPVREALIALERDGLVEFNDRSRTRVRPLTEQDFQEICSMRMSLESLAARIVAGHWDGSCTQFMEENIRKQELAATLGDLSRLDVEMHEFVVRKSGHRRLIAAWSGIRWQFEMCLAHTHRLQQELAFEPRRITVDSHRRLLAALASGKPELAAKTMSAHIEGALEWLLLGNAGQFTEPSPNKSTARNGSMAVRAARAVLFLMTLVQCLQLHLQAAEVSPKDAEFFESKVRPLLVDHCYECHSGAKNKGGLSLETRDGWSRGGDSGAAIVPGKPDESLLIKAVRHGDPDLAMPPKNKGGKLAAPQIAILEEWVRLGAPDPRVPAARIGGMSETEAKSWWAFQPLPKPGKAAATPAQLDAFIDRSLKTASLKPAPVADKRTLIRRATFDLTGLPPTPEEVEAFVSDRSRDAFSKVIDRLLASPQYGEKWGRHWLDVVRYADSLDSRIFEKEGDILDAWRYRDWVVNAFNRDLPYDQFITHQLAGDILAKKEWDAQKVVATGLYAIGNWGNGDADKEKVHTDIVDDQIDVTGRAFLGLTLACVRCHDHKFDPFTTRDYYGMAGVFFSSRILEKFAAKGAGESLMRIPLLSPQQLAAREQLRKRIAAIDTEFSSVLDPFTEFKAEVAGKSGLLSWKGRSADNPSLVINTADTPVAFSTIKLPARAIALHPGPKVAATAVWRSPVAATVKVSVRLQDADPNCGNGIEWLLRHGDTVLRSGEMNNATSADVEEVSVSVQPGELLQLIIRPRGEYSCDTTQIDFVVTDGQGRRWDLREALVGGAAQGKDDIWWLCSGEGAVLGKDSPKLKELAAERKQIEQQLARTYFAQGMLEGGIPQTTYEGYHDVAVHKRGRYDQLGDVVPRSLPALLTQKQPEIREGSGRLELARWIASADNPLTARVMVNRIWQHHFGEGLVRTPNNFGKLGTAPSHPALLDWLATEFIRSGWSVKHVHRLIMQSAAYQRSSTPVARASQVDPENRLLSHQHRRRLTAEELRDAMLRVSGKLDMAVGGKSVREITAPRRTLYLTTIRSDRTGYQSLFDGADPTAIVEKRTEATVAPQSLFLLNHPFTVSQAEALASAAVKAGSTTPERVRWLWQRLFQQLPAAADLSLADRALGGDADIARWTVYCQMLLCSNEFAYVD